MSFLKIDKKNISTFSKVILVMVFVVLFTFGFANKTFAVQTNGLPEGVTLNPNASDQGRSVFIANPNYDPNASFLSANSAKTINASGGQNKGSVYLGSDGKFYLAEFDPQSVGNLNSVPVIKDYVEITPATDQYGRIEIMKDVWIQKSDYTISNPSTAIPISATLDSNLIDGANGGTYTYMGIDTSNPNIQVWKDSKGNLMSLDTGAKTQSLQKYTGNSYNNNLPTTTFNNSLINGTQNTTVIKNSSGNFQAEKNPNNGQCWVGAGQGFLDIKNCLYQGLYYAIFWPISLLVGLAAWIFGVAFDTTVINMSKGINSIGAIDVAWKTMRDLANIGFIFILLYLAISTIIGAGEHDVKKTLSKLIMVAILLNFSLFFTKIIIDASNILAIAFYKSIVVAGGTKGAGTATSLGDAFMGAFRLQTLFTGPVTSTSGAAFASGNQPMSVLIGGTITMLVATIILLASLMMFLKRYIILILVMIFSPLAFAGMVLHQTEHSVQSWWNHLLKEAFFAPVYMIMLWISFTVINDTGFLTAIGENPTNNSALTREGITNKQSDAFLATDDGTTNDPGKAGVLLDFMIVSALLISSLVVAEKMGVSGASGAMNFAKGAQGAIQGGAMFTAGAAFNNTIGRWAGGYLNKGDSATRLAQAAAGEKGYARQQFARVQIAALKNLSSGHQTKLDAEVGYRKALEHEVHNDPQTRLDMLEKAAGSADYSVAKRAGDTMFDGWSSEDHANVSAQADMKLRDLEKDKTKAISKNDAKALADVESKIESTKLAMQKYYTGGVDKNGKPIHERIADKKSDVEKLKTDKLLNVQKSDLKNTPNMTEFGEKFKALTDVQKQQYTASLSKTEQDNLSSDLEFEKILAENANDFQSIEKFSRGASDGMKALLSKIAYQGVSRQKLFAKLQDDKFKDNKTLQQAFMDSFKYSGMKNTDGKNFDQLKEMYEKSERFNGDESCANSLANLNRAVRSNTDYTAMEKLIKNAKSTYSNSSDGFEGIGTS